MRSKIIAFALGVCLLQQQPQLPPLVWALLLLPVLVSWWWLRAANGRGAALAAALLANAMFAAAGFFYAAAWAQWRLADRLPPQWEGVDLAVTGVVAGLPQPFEGGVRFDFDVEQVEPATARLPRRVALSWYNGTSREEFQDIAPIRAGERWHFSVRLRRPHGSANPEGFDYESWLLQRAIGATGYVRPGGTARLDDLALRPAYFIERMREILRERYWDSLPGYPYAGILIALAIGDQNAIDARQWQLFARTGVSHLMSISGLHVTLVASLFAALIGSDVGAAGAQGFGTGHVPRRVRLLPDRRFRGARAAHGVYGRRGGPGAVGEPHRFGLARVVLRFAGSAAARSLGGARAGFLAFFRCRRGHPVWGDGPAAGAARAHAGPKPRSMGTRPVGNYAGPGAAASRLVPADVAGIAACQCHCDSAGEHGGDAACFGRKRAAFGFHPETRTCGDGGANVAARMVCRTAAGGVAAARARSLDCGAGPCRDRVAAVAAGRSGALAGSAAAVADVCRGAADSPAGRRMDHGAGCGPRAGSICADQAACPALRYRPRVQPRGRWRHPRHPAVSARIRHCKPGHDDRHP